MKNKKGFTLVELLAVIAILAILVVIALPNVLDMFNNAKEGSFVTELQELIKTAQSQYILDGGAGVTYIHKNDTSGNALTCSNGNALKMQGTTALEYSLTLDSKGRVTEFFARDVNYSYRYPLEGESNTGELKIQNINADRNAQGAVVDIAGDPENENLVELEDIICQ